MNNFGESLFFLKEKILKMFCKTLSIKVKSKHRNMMSAFQHNKAIFFLEKKMCPLTHTHTHIT